MSSFYYKLRSPVTSLQFEDCGDHERLSIWVDHEFAGTLTLKPGAAQDIALMMVEGNPCLHCWFGGQERGTVVSELTSPLPDATIVVGDRGGIHTVAQVRAMAGRGKKGASECV